MFLWVVLTAVIAVGLGATSVYLLMRHKYTIGRTMWAMQDGVLLLDEHSRIAHVTPQFEIYTGMSAEDVLGLRYTDLLTRFNINTLVLDGVEKPRFEVIYNDRILEPIVSTAYDANAIPFGKVVIFRDVTRRSRAEYNLGSRVERLTALRRVHDELSTSLNVQTVLMLALDAAHRLSAAHSGYIALKDDDGHYTVAQMIGAYERETLNEMLRMKNGLVWRVLEDEQAVRITDVYNLPDYIPLLPSTQALIIVPLIHSDGDMMGILSLSTPYPARFTEDMFQFVQLLSNRISASIENARLYAQVAAQLQTLRENHKRISLLEKFKTDMIRLAAHDLNNPLSTIMLKAELMQRQGNLTEKQLGYVRGIHEAAERMRELIGNILSLERIEQFIDAGASAFETVDLHATVQEIVASHQERAQAKSVTLTYHDLSAAQVRGDRAYLHEAVANLISNAVKYTPPGGSIHVSITRDDGNVVLCVKDTGYGIPDEQQSQVFQPFFRAEMEETAHITGTGLGLHLVRKIIEQHGGETLFESEYGVGSQFGFRLPAANESLEAENPPP